MLSLRRSIALLVIATAVLAPAAAAYCPSSFQTAQFGGNQTYDCFLTDQDDDYCYYECSSSV